MFLWGRAVMLVLASHCLSPGKQSHTLKKHSHAGAVKATTVFEGTLDGRREDDQINSVTSADYDQGVHSHFSSRTLEEMSPIHHKPAFAFWIDPTMRQLQEFAI